MIALKIVKWIIALKKKNTDLMKDTKSIQVFLLHANLESHGTKSHKHALAANTV